jgi:hypothetical protein
MMSGILSRIALTLFRWSLIWWGLFPLFESDVLVRWWLEIQFLTTIYSGFDFWPRNLLGHICKLLAAFLVQTAVWAYLGEQRVLRDVIQLHPLVWVSFDVIWTILYQHATLPVPSDSVMWYIAGLDINPFFLVSKAYPIITRAWQ